MALDDEIDLGDLFGTKVARIEGYVSDEFGEPTIILSRIVFEDGRSVSVGGEHDMPFIEGLDADMTAKIEAVADDDDED